MRRSSITVLGLVAGTILALDRWTKRWASESLPYNQPVEVLGDYLRLTYTRNSGVAFGIGQGTGFPYYLFSLVAAVAILYLFVRHRDMTGSRQLALSLIFGGAIGNLIDRVTTGEVVDFIEIGFSRWHWPVFNVADMAVTTGVALFALTWHRHPGAAAGRADAGHAPRHDDRTATPGAGEPSGGAAGSLPGGGPGGPVA